MKKKQFFGLGVGMSSIIMVFVILCLTTLAVLAYFCAKADSRLTDKKEKASYEYTTADNNAKTKLMKFDEALYTAAQNQNTLVDMMSSYSEDFSFIDDRYVVYLENISDNMQLYVKLEINIDDNGYIQLTDRYKICSWKTVNYGYDLEEEELNLWGDTQE